MLISVITNTMYQSVFVYMAGVLRLCSTSTGGTMSENEDTAVETTDESKFFTYDGPNPKLSYPLKIIYCDGKYDIL